MALQLQRPGASLEEHLPYSGPGTSVKHGLCQPANLSISHWPDFRGDWRPWPEVTGRLKSESQHWLRLGQNQKWGHEAPGFQAVPMRLLCFCR